MKIFLILILFFFTKGVCGQVALRQMVSSNGISKLLPNGLMVSQTIGQQSITGSFSENKFLIQQGFQQALITNIANVTGFVSNQTIAFPNPFVDIIYFNFSQHIKENLTVMVYDNIGRIVYKHVFISPGDSININLGLLNPQNYVVSLSAPNYSFATIIIKE